MVNAILGMNYDLSQRLSQIERNIRDLSTQPILRNASTGQSGGQGLSTDLNGLHLFNPSGVETATLSTIDGSATFGGNVIINGNLSVPNGSISNAALLNPVQYGSVGVSENNYTVDTTSRKRGVTTITVPAGYSKATVLTIANVNGANSTASADILLIQAYAGATPGGSSAGALPANSTGSASASAINSFTGLSGGTIEVGCYVSCNTGPWASSVWNLANVNAVVWFTR